MKPDTGADMETEAEADAAAELRLEIAYYRNLRDAAAKAGKSSLTRKYRTGTNKLPSSFARERRGKAAFCLNTAG